MSYGWEFDQEYLVAPSVQLITERLRFKRFLEGEEIRNIGVTGSKIVINCYRLHLLSA